MGRGEAFAVVSGTLHRVARVLAAGMAFRMSSLLLRPNDVFLTPAAWLRANASRVS